MLVTVVLAIIAMTAAPKVVSAISMSPWRYVL